MTIVEISELIGLITAGIGLIATIGAFIKTTIKNIREKKLKAYVETFMVEAESKNLSGEEKREYVLRGILEYASAIGGNVVKLTNQASDYIEECIEFSKKINSK